MIGGWVIWHPAKTEHASNATPYEPLIRLCTARSRLASVLTRAIDWDLIAQQYDPMVQYATALRLGTAQTEDILRRFTRSNVQHPVYRALAELGKAQKTVFLCHYLGVNPTLLSPGAI